MGLVGDGKVMQVLGGMEGLGDSGEAGVGTPAGGGESWSSGARPLSEAGEQHAPCAS